MVGFKKFLYRYSRGLKNKMKYGGNGPEFGELIYVNPENHTCALSKHREFSGKVVPGDWDLRPKRSIVESKIYKSCVLHWEEGVAWEDTGMFQYMLNKIEKFKGEVDNCSNLDDIKIRYQKLDKLFEEIKKTRKFKTQQELNPRAFNEHGGLMFHIDRENKPIFAGAGMHRFAMTKILGLTIIPAQIGMVHPEAIKTWRCYKNKAYCMQNRK